MHQQTLSIHPGLLSYTSETSGQLCVNRRKRLDLCPPVSLTLDLSLVVRVLSSTLLPGFIGPESSVPPVNCHPLHTPPLRVLLCGFSFMAFIAIAGGLPWVRRTTSPYPGPLHYGSIRRILGLAYPRGLDLLPTAIKPVRCPLRTWFLPHASSRHPVSGNALALLALPFRPITAGVLLLPAPYPLPEARPVRHARRTLGVSQQSWAFTQEK